MPSQNQLIRRALREALVEACEAMRAHKQAIDRTAADFRHCTRRSRDSIKASEATLFRLRTGPQPHARGLNNN
jgi:hypothetical protein